MGKTSQGDLKVALLLGKGSVRAITQRSWQVVHDQRAVDTRGHSPGPETLAETSAEGKCKWAVGVGGKQLLKAVHIHWGHNCKEVRVHGDCVVSYRVQEFIGRRAR